MQVSKGSILEGKIKPHIERILQGNKTESTNERQTERVEYRRPI